MPEYAYRCNACGKRFAMTMGIKKHETAKVPCPKCSSKRVRHQITRFAAVTKKKS